MDEKLIIASKWQIVSQPATVCLYMLNYVCYSEASFRLKCVSLPGQFNVTPTNKGCQFKGFKWYHSIGRWSKTNVPCFSSGACWKRKHPSLTHNIKESHANALKCYVHPVLATPCFVIRFSLWNLPAVSEHTCTNKKVASETFRQPPKHTFSMSKATGTATVSHWTDATNFTDVIVGRFDRRPLIIWKLHEIFVIKATYKNVLDVYASEVHSCFWDFFFKRTIKLSNIILMHTTYRLHIIFCLFEQYLPSF